MATSPFHNRDAAPTMKPEPMTGKSESEVEKESDGAAAELRETRVSSVVVETPRLRLRRMTPEDLDSLIKVFGDPETMRFYPAPFSREQVESWIEWNLRNYEVHGYGLWAVILKWSGEVVGDCGLTWQRVGYSEDRELEIGWHTRRDLWNQGIATEAALTVRDYAFEVLARTRLIAIIDPENQASQAVARKLGMTLERTNTLHGNERVIFAIETPTTISDWFET